MRTRTVRLSFSSPVHFASGRLSDSECTCDAATLFSALYLEAMHLGCAEALLKAAKNSDLTISDALPYVGDVLYLPKPLMRVERAQAQTAQPDSREKKANKKLGYVSLGNFASCLEGGLDAVRELQGFRLGTSHLQAKVNLTRSDSSDSEPKPYHVGSFSFYPGAGLYFLLQGSFDLEPVLESLSYSGIGGKRSSGYGRFTFAIDEHDPFESFVHAGKPRRRYLLLSTAMPTKEELNDSLIEGAHYLLVRKGGFVQSETYAAKPLKKRDAYLFSAGSVFSRTFAGDVFDVGTRSGSHPVYRYARAFWLEV